MKRRPILALVSCLLASSVASADEGNVCKDAYEQSQLLMKPSGEKSTLLPAREALRTCMRSSCRDWMEADCSRWLSEVEARIPTVVFSARNTAGRDLLDVKVTSPSGDVVAPRMDGRVVEVEPGEQLFVFVAPDGARVEKRVIVREGEKAQSVAAVFEAPPDELRAASPPSEGPHAPVDARPPSSEPASGTSALRYTGYGLTGLGVVGLGLGAVFGLTAMSKKSDANCDANNACDPGPLAEARSAATASTVAFAVGGALAAGGITLIVLAPSSQRVETRAMLTPAGGGFAMGGRW